MRLKLRLFDKLDDSEEKRTKVNESKPVKNRKLKGKMKRMINRADHDHYKELEE